MTYLYKNGDLISIDLDGQAILNDMTTHGTGRLAEATYGNGTPYKMAFDKAGRPTQQQRGPQSVQYSYDKNGNITRQGNTQYDYDALGRLTAANDPQYKLAYDYDANGNRLSLITTHADKTENIPYAYANGTNRLIGMGKEKIAYDATGRRTEDARFTYAYNARGRLERISNKQTNTSTHYQYRLDGLRVSKSTGNETAFYVYDASQRLVAEANAKGEIQKEYLWLGLMPVVVIEDDNIYYIHPDHLGTPRLATNKDKQIVWQWRSTPFGKGKPNENGLTLNLRFPGQYYDEETGLHYNWFRYYEPETGRYIGADPISLKGGVNIYVYANSSPVSYIDLYGLFSLVIGIEVPKSDPLFEGTLNTTDPGHTFAYLVDNDGIITNALSFGPKDPVQENLQQFLTGTLEGVTDYQLRGIASLFAFDITEQQYKDAFSIINDYIANPQSYKFNRQCTTEALALIEHAGIDIPPGFGPIISRILLKILYYDTEANPLALYNDLVNEGYAPVDVDTTSFTNSEYKIYIGGPDPLSNNDSFFDKLP